MCFSKILWKHLAWLKSLVLFQGPLAVSDLSTGKVITSLNRKPLAGSTVLRSNSCHHRHIIFAIPKGEYVRTKWACTQGEDFCGEVERINKHLINRGYKYWTLKDAESNVRFGRREELLNRERTEKRREDSESSIFSTAFRNKFEDIKRIVKKHLPVLHRDETL